MATKLTSWQRLDRIAYKYKARTHGYNVRDIADALLRSHKVSVDDKQRVKEIMEEWAKSENRRHESES